MAKGEIMKEAAKVKATDYGEPLWIYFQGVIQCFICGWYHESDNVESAAELWRTHAIIGAHTASK